MHELAGVKFGELQNPLHKFKQNQSVDVTVRTFASLWTENGRSATCNKIRLLTPMVTLSLKPLNGSLSIDVLNRHNIGTLALELFLPFSLS